MKKSTKVLIALSFISCLAGVGMMTAGAMMGGLEDLDRVAYPLFGKRNFDMSVHYPDESGEIQNIESEVPNEFSGETAEYTNIRDLKVDIIGDSRIELIQEIPENLPQDKIRIVRSGDDTMKYVIEVKGDTLDIHLPRDWKEYINQDHRDVEDLTIYIPQNYQFNSVDLDCVSGYFAADAIFARELAVDIVSGNIDIAGGRVGDIDIDCVSGGITCHALIDQGADVDCTSGDIDITMARSWSGYDYEWNSLGGTIILDGREMEQNDLFKQEQKIDNHTGRSIDLECVSGTININYANES